jgi:hypothetical protein
MIKPDDREALWYDLNNMLNIDADSMPHYWTTLMDKFKIFDIRERQNVCMVCNEHNVFEYKDKSYCYEEYQPKIKIINDEEVIYGITKISENIHKVSKEYPNDSVRRITKEVLNMVEEIGGYRMDLFDLEYWMFMKEADMFFETKDGYVTKEQLLKKLYHLKKFVISEMTILRHEIRFSSLMSAPSIKL